jgi:hypothetical protein
MQEARLNHQLTPASPPRLRCPACRGAAALSALPNNGSDSPQCPCNRSYKPVCGSNGKLYNHPCLAQCEGAGVSFECGQATDAGA